MYQRAAIKPWSWAGRRKGDASFNYLHSPLTTSLPHFRVSPFHFLFFLFSTVLSFIPISHAIAFRHFPGASLSSPLFHSHFFTFLSLHHFTTLAPPIFGTSSSFTLSYRHSVPSSSFACLLFLSAFLPLVLWNKLSWMMTSRGLLLFPRIFLFMDLGWRCSRSKVATSNRGVLLQPVSALAYT